MHKNDFTDFINIPKTVAIQPNIHRINAFSPIHIKNRWLVVYISTLHNTYTTTHGEVARFMYYIKLKKYENKTANSNGEKGKYGEGGFGIRLHAAGT